MTTRILPVVLLGAASLLGAQTQDWVERSNEHAKVLLEALAKMSPEGAASLGIESVDEEIRDLKTGYRERNRSILRAAAEELARRLRAEQHPKVKQDLEIMLRETELSLDQSRVYERLMTPYFDLSRMIFYSVQGLLDNRIAEARRPAALVRLRRYAGMEEGYEPIASLARTDLEKALAQAELVTPFRGEIEKNLTDAPLMIDGIGPLFEKFGIPGYQDVLATLTRQLREHNGFLKDELLPKARTDFRQPREIYVLRLKEIGIDITPESLANQARGAFREIQLQMQEIAVRIAAARGWASSDYREVIRELKREQIVGEAILPHYNERLAEIEEIVRREKLVTLPGRKARIRLASEAESAALPAPHMSPPRLVGNTGEQGEFVLPLNVPDADGEMQAFDDFTFAAGSWTLTAHEARPGHEMQFAAMVESGVSTARSVFAFNSTNVEGWALYTESFMKPYMPLEGQLISLQHRLLRAARAYLDPELQLGKLEPEEAFRVLLEDVVLSEPMATQEVERYTFRMPGQAGSYFYGYSRMIALRSDVQKALGENFEPRQFHDFILSQGLIPPSLLREAVFTEFLPGARSN